MAIKDTLKGRLYRKLKKMGILDVPNESWVLIKNEPFMDFSIERHGREVFISHTCHYDKEDPFSDLMSDPHVRILLNEELEVASGTYYQNDYVGVQQVVRGTFYKEDGTPFEGVKPKQENDLNKFILQWLDNVRSQNYDIKGSVKELLS